MLLADLPKAIELVVDRIGDVAAVGADVPALMDALPPLARVLRYGNVRGTDATAVSAVVDGLVARICIGLGGAAASLDDDAAAAFARQVDGVHGAIALLDDAEDRAAWREALRRLIDQEGLHGLVAGRGTRLLLDEGVIDSADAARRMRLVLSPGAEPDRRSGLGRGLPPRQRHDPASRPGPVRHHRRLGHGHATGRLRQRPAVAPPDDRDVQRPGAQVDRRADPRRTTRTDHAALTPASMSVRADLVMPILARILGVDGDGP